MAVMDEFEKEREQVKNASFKKKLVYFLDYNKGKVIIAIILIAFLSWFLVTVLSKKEQVMCGIFLNCYEQEYITGEFSEEYLEKQSFDPKTQETYFVTDLTYQAGSEVSVETNQALTVYASSGVMDFIVAEPEVLDELANKYYFADLTDVLSEEEYQALMPYFVFYENEEHELVPILIHIGKNERMQKAYGEEIEELCVGVLLDAPHTEGLADYIDYLM